VGKSTITNLIARFWDVDQGCIKIGETDIRDLPPDHLLSHIGMVFQKVYLFNDSIYNNIRIGDLNAGQEKIEQAARAANCHEFISKLPQGYQTKVGEGGSTLSGGEKQRIAIARTILKDPPIILMDEATASLDLVNENLVQQAVDNLVKSKTLVVIAHRLRVIAQADQILVLDKGTIAERGTHRQLISANGIYAEMCRKQNSAPGWRN
jgi:ATP-binding cassette subfamily B protein